MGRPKKSAPAPIEPEEESQEILEEEVDVEEVENDKFEESGNGRSFNQAELVRKAVAAGHEKPATGVEYIKRHFGADIDPKYYSVAKSQFRKREAQSSFSPEPAKRGRKPNAPASLVEGYVAPPEKPRAAGESDVLLALESVKELVQKFGADKLKRMVDLMG